MFHSTTCFDDGTIILTHKKIYLIIWIAIIAGGEVSSMPDPKENDWDDEPMEDQENGPGDPGDTGGAGGSK